MEKALVNSERLREVLKKYWGYDSFRPLQEEIILHVSNGSDALALLPTGGGKSVCFQVPALVLDGLCIVVSPLIALMKDQVEGLKQKGIPAEAIYTGLSMGEIQLYIDRAVKGELKFLYISPERLKNRAFISALLNMNICLIAVDEAHCISEWGYDFRPHYLQVSDLRLLLPNVPLIALTATATKDVVEDILKRLNIKDKKVFSKSFVRDNLTYYVVEEEDKLGRLIRAIRKIGGSGVVYVRNRRKTVEIAESLICAGISAEAYHAGFPPAEKNRRQENWTNNKTQVIVATNAFGMGIDKSDVRFVIHIDLPDTIEAYFQEAGRGGRDGKPAFALLLYHKSDIIKAKQKFDTTYPSLKFIKQVYEGIFNYYRIPMGTGEGAEEEFILNDFVRMYNFPLNETASALGFLEREGYFRFSDTVKQWSKVHIIADRQQLYDIEVKNEEYEILLKALLRLYGGRLFSDYVSISEKEIASKIEQKESFVIERLNFLNKNSYIEYKPLSKHPTLIILQERIEPDKFFLSSKVYSDRKKIAKNKLDYMLNYASEIRQCRSVYLVSYFGDKKGKKCGSCDYCLRGERDGMSDQEYEKIYKTIMPVLSEQALDIRSVCDMFPDLDQDKCCLFWQYVIDKGYIQESPLDGVGCFRLNKDLKIQ